MFIIYWTSNQKTKTLEMLGAAVVSSKSVVCFQLILEVYALNAYILTIPHKEGSDNTVKVVVCRENKANQANQAVAHHPLLFGLIQRPR